MNNISLRVLGRFRCRSVSGWTAVQVGRF